jgi:hypothetical protein
MRDIGKLMDAICEAYNMSLPVGAGRNLFEPFFSVGEARWYTKCNEAFNFIARRMNYDHFDMAATPNPTDAALANVMFAEMNDPNGHWRRIDAILAQKMANEGCLVAAASKNEPGHGHICVIMPGTAELSGTYAEMVPKVMNVGKDVFIGKKASFAFRQEQKPSYFCLKHDFNMETFE